MDIEKIIKSNFFLNKKDIRLDNFIKSALYSKNGYYYNKKPIGKKNDFVTAPEISQTFGEIIGIYLFYNWKVKIKSKFNLIELGPGRGTLFKDIENSVKNYPEFLSYANISFIEINNELIKVQKNNFKKIKFYKFNWSKSINFRSKLPSIIYSNEFFDCFPVRQFIKKNLWFEKFVSVNEKNNNFYFKDKLVKNKKLIYKLNRYKEKVLEISIERNKYFEKICKFIKMNGGIFLTIDYGYDKNIKNFTLQAIQNHKPSHVLENIGNQDISSHVNFKDLIEIANSYKLNIEEFCTQRQFLIKYGILERKEILSKSSHSKKINTGVDRLINKKEMGNLFKFLIISNL